MSQNLKPTPVTQFLADINAGVLEKQIAHAISDVAAAVAATGGKGKIVLTLEVGRIPNTGMLNVNHKMEFTAPTTTGTRREDTKGTTPMHVGTGGKLTLFPENQMDFLKSDETAKA